MTARSLRLGAALLWSLSLMPEEGRAASDEVQLDDVQDCDEEVNKSDPFHSCLCKRWEKTFKKRYPDVDYSACEKLYNDKETGDKFLEWYAQYKRNYTDYAEKKKRFAIFAANYVYMQFKNKTTNDYSLDVNEFADLDPDEFRQTRLGLSSQAKTDPSLGTFSTVSGELPEKIDYVELGAVNTPVNQGNAQSCWSFTAAASVEGGWQKRTGVLVELSAQQFLDCTGHGMDAVVGGDLTTPIREVAVDHDLCSAVSYPYIERDGTCTQSKPSCTPRIPSGAVTGYKNIKPNDEGALMTALYLNGPVGVGIAADGTQLMFYRRGVMTADCPGLPNHAVNLVGYGSVGALDYWKLKNSWGATWGEHGFFRLKRDGKDDAGKCSLKYMPAMPVFTDDETVLGMAAKLGNEPVKEVKDTAVKDVNEALGEVKDDSETTWDDRWADFKRNTLSEDVSWTKLWIYVAVAGVACCLFGCCFGSCCCGGKSKSRGVALLEGDDEDEDYYYSSDDE